MVFHVIKNFEVVLKVVATLSLMGAFGMNRRALLADFVDGRFVSVALVLVRGFFVLMNGFCELS